jgi:hypothetical protein
VNLSLLIGPACVLLGMLATLYVKNQAQEVAKAAVKEGIEAALATFKNDLLEQMDKTYVRMGECKLKTDSQDDRIDMHELSITEIDKRLRELNPPRRTH